MELDPAISPKSCTTKSELIKFSFSWTMENFSFFPQEPRQSIKSSEFCAGANDEFKWSLILYPRGVDRIGNLDYISAYLKLFSLPLGKTKIICMYTFSIINGKGEQTQTQIQTLGRECKKHGLVGFRYFIQRDFLFKERKELLPNDNLTIFCEASFINEPVTMSGDISNEQFSVPEIKPFEDFNNLVLNENFKDVILEIGGEEIKAHKAVLAGQSDVFAALLEKNKVDRVAVKDIDAEILKEIVNFIYTGKAINLDKNANVLLAAADKYALNKLKAMCEKVLLNNLSVETAADTLILAHLHDSNHLKKQTIHFIKSHIKDVMNTKGWQKMIITTDGSNLLAEIIQTPPALQ